MAQHSGRRVHRRQVLGRLWEDPPVRWVGNGSELWRVRVDLFAPDDDGGHVPAAHEALKRQLTASDEAVRGPGETSADQGTGIARRSVVGLSFWVRADDVGEAARTAVDTAQRAGAEHGVGTELYDVVVIPNAAVARPDDPGYPRMPD
jgi:hypothetical protein